MVKQDAGFFLPNQAGRFEQRESPQDVGLHEILGPEDRAIHVGFRSEMNDGVDLEPLEHPLYSIEVADVGFFKEIAFPRELRIDVG